MRSERARFGRIEIVDGASENVLEPNAEEVIKVPLIIGRQEYLFSVAFGSITQVKTQAILSPTSSGFDKEVIGGPSGAILKVANLGRVEMKLREKARQRLTSYKPSADNGAPVGFSLAHDSGELKSRGIRHIIFTNIVPGPDWNLDVPYVTQCVAGALIEANNVGDSSLAIPAFETGFAGMPIATSIEGSLKSLERYHDTLNGAAPTTTRLVEVLLYQPSYENIMYIKDILDKIVGR